MICPICKTDNGKDPKNCSNCNWEFVYFLTEPSEIEIENYKEKVELAKLKYEKQPNTQIHPQKRENDSWIDKLIKWADENNISQDRFPRDKEKLYSLTKLTLVDNNLNDLPKEIGNLINLKELYLGENNISVLPEEIGNLSNLNKLTLWNNNLNRLPDNITNLKNLTHLNLTNNPKLKLNFNQEQWIKLLKHKGGEINIEIGMINFIIQKIHSVLS